MQIKVREIMIIVINNHSKDSNNENNKVPKENVIFMLKSKLDEALQKKRKDLHFYPVLYFEGFKTNDVKRHYYNNTDGIVLASTNYYNVTDLDHNLKVFLKILTINLLDTLFILLKHRTILIIVRPLTVSYYLHYQ